MSSYLVSYEKVNEMFGINKINEFSLLSETLISIFGTDDKTKIGRKLLKMNVEALKQRYPNDKDNTRPAPTETRIKGCDKYAEEYIFGIELKSNSIEQAYMSTNCLEYQCCEGTVPKTKLFKQLTQYKNKLANAIAWRTVEEKKCKWR